MIRTYDKQNHKVHLLWQDPMKGVSSKSSLVLTVEFITSSKCFIVHAKRVIIYPATRLDEQALQELREQSVHYVSTYHTVDLSRGGTKTPWWIRGIVW